MKKSTLLSLLTAASIVVTTAGTYAAWDSVEASSSVENVTFRKPVTVTVGTPISLETSGTELGTKTLNASGKVKFTVSNEDNLADTLTIVPAVTGDPSVSASDFDFEISDTSGLLTKVNSGDSSKGFTDKTLTAESTEYTVKVIPKEGSKDAIGGKKLTVKLTATLSKSEQA